MPSIPRPDLFILPLDHRGTFEHRLLKLQRPPTPEERHEISAYKRVIYEGFLRAVQSGIPKPNAGVLVDEEYGTEILKEAKARGFITACTVEKSGRDELEFEYGDAFSKHLQALAPTYAKVLARFNPEGDRELNRRQLARLKTLSDFCKSDGSKIQLMLELLVPPTPVQLDAVGGNSRDFDFKHRPALMIQSLKEMQNHGIDPALWKVEGLESRSAAEALASQARAGEHFKGLIVLGRGEDEESVRKWLTTAAQVSGYIGFAVGRTLFWESIRALKEGRAPRNWVVNEISQNFRSYCNLWNRERYSKSLNIKTPAPDATL